MNEQKLFPYGIPTTAVDAWRDFKMRRKGVLRAILSEFDKLHEQCVPENVDKCLYGLPNGTWVLDGHMEEEDPILREFDGFPIQEQRSTLDIHPWIRDQVAVQADIWFEAFQNGLFKHYLSSDERVEFEKKVEALPSVVDIVCAECCVCAQQFEDGKLFVCHPCDKWYHMDCLFGILHEKSKCPTCN